ncbi:MAG: hypothetical protein AAB368_08295, partial [bacterium]
MNPDELPTETPDETEPERIARLRADLAVLKARGAPQEIVDYYLKSRGHITTPEQELAKMPPDAAVESPAAVQALGATAGAVMGAIPGGKAATAALMSLPVV